MGLFSLSDNKAEYGVIIEIGSGSVLAAIVELSDYEKDLPKILWSKREYTPLKQIDSLNRSIKSIMTSFMNVAMSLDSEGRKVLHEHSSKAKLSRLQITISAPWSYTVSKTISYKNDKDFVINEAFLDELLRMARQKMEEELKENEKVNNLGLRVVSRVTAGVTANGYPIKVTNKQKTNSAKVIELSVITEDRVAEKIEETKDKILPEVYMQQYSFMAVFFYTVLDLYNNLNDCCLVDVTYEATEIGIVRNGVLQYCTHTPYGVVSLAREISAVLSVPLEEAKGYLSEPNFDTVLQKCSNKQKKEIETIFSAYKEKMSDLFRETGDKLSVPKLIFLHNDHKNSEFFKEHINSAASKVTGTTHIIHDVTNDLLDKYYKPNEEQNNPKPSKDTGLLVSAQFFHKRNREYKFEQL